MFDLPRVRAAFPALTNDYALFDNAGGSQTLGRVADAVRDYLLTTNVQLGASYAVSAQAKAKVLAATERFRVWCNARRADELMFGASCTQLLANLALALRSKISAGDEIILTNSEHEANAGPWKRLAEQAGASVKYWRVNPEACRLDVADLEALLTPRTKLIAMCQVSNILGVINPVAAMVQLAKPRGIITVVDGVAFAAHAAVDVQALGCDAYVVSLYKIFGPHIGLMYLRHELMQTLPNVNHGHIPHEVMPYRLQPGGVCYELVVGAAGLVDYLEQVGRQLGGELDSHAAIAAALRAFHGHENQLTEQLLAFLRRCERVRIIGPREVGADRVGTVSFVVQGATPESICLAVDPHNVGIRHGHFHTVQLLQDWGVFDSGGVVRASFGHYNSVEEVERLIAALRPVLAD
ncbi:cysteine desulfurase-like protein [Permianibacter sp. IMCC34836]|uniref:cysteine desulfurase-like protein n=1 Tax=Permianibacter fluminis TaxID=2738515 RepID=UPI001554296A|nr:cysteine desulfurase-like protein [Permianibacter fluminis]NQD37673.1 cysteine desulfurase-like protein [Permianibacter fluminis]